MSSENDNSDVPTSLEEEKSIRYSFPKEGESRSNAFSVVVIVIVTIIAVIAGIIAIRVLPPIEPAPPRNNISIGNEFRRIPPTWVGYRLESAFPVEMDRLKTLTVGPNDEFLIGGDKRIQVFSLDFELQKTLELGAEPQAIALADENHSIPARLYVAFRNHIEVFSPAFEKVASWKGFNEQAIFSSIALGENEIFIADAGNMIVHVLSTEGRVLRVIGQKSKAHENPSDDSVEISADELGDNEAEFNGFVVYATPVISVIYSHLDGLLRVTSPGRHRIETFTTQGHWETPLSWGNRTNYFEGFSGCCNPVSITMLSDGNIVTMETHGLQRIKVYSNLGQLEAVVATTDDLEISPLPGQRKVDDSTGLYSCVCANSEDEIVVLDPVYRAVRIYKKNPEYKRP